MRALQAPLLVLGELAGAREVDLPDAPRAPGAPGLLGCGLALLRRLDQCLDLFVGEDVAGAHAASASSPLVIVDTSVSLPPASLQVTLPLPT